MICAKCGAANDNHSGICGQCGSPLTVQPANGPEDVKPSWDITRISPRNFFREHIIDRRFKIIKSLGKGGMGEIFLAEDSKLKRKVAIKSISSDSGRDCDSKSRLLREAQAASRLDHHNICTIYEIAEENNNEYIIMQYVDGVTLGQLLKLKSLSLSQIIDVALQITDGMIEAHSQNIIHRDIKPGNIMIDKNGRVKILDFGLAKICPGKAASKENDRPQLELTEKGIVMGTVSYMSPEQAKGLDLDGRSDIFSFGIVLYEMLQGENPFSSKENIGTLYNILHKEIKFNREIPVGLQEIVYKAMQKDRNRRYADFMAVKKDLSALNTSLEKTHPQILPPKTEIIAPHEKMTFGREADHSAAHSTDENLSSMVRHLKRMKASTEAVKSFTSRRIWLGLAALVPLVVVLLLLIIHFARPAPVTMDKSFFHILLYPFENQSQDEKISEQIHYLLRESLNQFAEFKVLDDKNLNELNDGKTISSVQLPLIMKKFNIRYILRGKLSNVADKFSIEANFSKIGSRQNHAPFFIPGKESNSLLTDQVDNLSRRVYQAVFPEKEITNLQFKRLAGIYGSNWQAFKLFYQGFMLWNKKEFSAARQALLSAESLAGELPIARYFLALLADYTDSSAEALQYVNFLLPKLELFSQPLQLKIHALKAKYDFNFQEQIRNLQELRKWFPFNKESFYELGEAYFRYGNARKAIPEYQSALTLDPNYADALNHMGYCYSYLGRHLQAIECFEKYRDIDRTANSFDSLGDGYFYKGDYTQAENNKIYAVSLDHSMSWPYLTMADIQILKANFQQAEANLNEYEKKADYPKAKADALAKKAFIFFLNHDFNQALRLTEQAIQTHHSTMITDNSSEYHWLKGLCQIGLKNLPAAKQELSWLQTLKEKFNLGADNFNLAFKFFLHLEALIAEKENRAEKARRIFAELVQMKTQLSFWITYYNYQFFLSEYAAFLLRQELFSEAETLIVECLGFNPNYPPALWVAYSLSKYLPNKSGRDILRKIAEIYGPGREENIWRRQLKTEWQ